MFQRMIDQRFLSLYSKKFRCEADNSSKWAAKVSEQRIADRPSRHLREGLREHSTFRLVMRRVALTGRCASMEMTDSTVSI